MTFLNVSKYFLLSIFSLSVTASTIAWQCQVKDPCLYASTHQTCVGDNAGEFYIENPGQGGFQAFVLKTTPQLKEVIAIPVAIGEYLIWGEDFSGDHKIELLNNHKAFHTYYGEVVIEKDLTFEVKCQLMR